MTLKANWNKWSIPLCVAASLTTLPAVAQDLIPSAPGAVEASITDEEAPQPLATAEGEDGAPAELPLEPVPEENTPVGEPALDTATGEAAPAGPEIKAEPVDTPEVVEERYPNGQLKTVREVVQDEKGNYLNHGAWKMLNERGAVIMEGQYYEDERHGVWNRWYAGGEVAFLRQKPFTDFSAPFISQGIFDNGTLHGVWIVYDGKQRKVCEIRFNRGERDGVATWWHPNGRKMREMKFDAGIVHGVVQEWHPDGSVAKQENFDQGRKLTTQTMHYGGDLKKFSGTFLEPPLTPKNLDDWTKGEMAVYQSTGKSIKHGTYTAWHPNGQMRMQGEYKYDSPVGTFTWLYSNGQKALEGDYNEGKQEGEWNWWHENGQRSIRGHFANGNPSDKWTWWNKEGKVAQSGDFSDDKGQIVVTPMIPAAPQQAELPAAAPKPTKR